MYDELVIFHNRSYMEAVMIQTIADTPKTTTVI